MSPNDTKPNIFSRLFGNATEDDLTDEELDQLDAEAKAERKRFHREKVANGPVKFTSMTNGQVRRAEKRAKKARNRKANRRHRSDWMDSRRQHAALRGKLQAVGVLPGSFGVPAPTSSDTVARIAALLVEQYGSVEQALAIYQRAQAQIDAEQAKIDEAEALRKLQERLDKQYAAGGAMPHIVANDREVGKIDGARA